MTVLLAILLLQAGPAPRDIGLSVLPQNPVQGQLLIIEVSGALPGDTVKGTFGKRKLRFYLDKLSRVRALTSVELSQRPGQVSLTIEVVLPDGEKVIKGLAVQVRAGEFDEINLRVDPKFVKPPKRVQARIKRERQAIQQLWQRKATWRKWSGSFVWPRKDQICSRFGVKRMFNKKQKSRHYGVDIDGKVGGHIRAIGAGRVIMKSDRFYAGQTLIIDHGLKLYSLYFHLSGFLVSEGDLVDKGQLIGKVGRTGRVTGPHLHLSTKIEDVNFDPLSLLEADLSEEAQVAP